MLIARAASRLASFDFARAVVTVLVVIGAVTWVYGILHRIFDYDEWVHAHESWLIRSGLKPFRDFFECHPPFVWYPLSLSYRVFGDSYNLMYVFRFVTAVGHVVFFVAMLKNVALSLRDLPTPRRLPVHLAALAVALIALDPAVIDYLVEFRLDSWPNALLMIAIYRYRTRRRGPLRSSIELAALSTAAILCSPKLIVFIGVFTVASIIVDDRRLLRVAGMLAGGAGMLALAVGFMLLVGLNPIHVYRLALGYHSVLNAKGGFGHGVFENVWGREIIRNVVIASAIAWPLVAWRRIHRGAFEIAVLLYLVLQLKLVGFGYKQYYGPWFLLAIAFLPYLEVLARRIRPAHSLLLAAAVLYIGDSLLPQYRALKEASSTTEEIKGRKDMEASVPPGHFVVGQIEAMPLFRRNAFYQHHNSYAPSGFDGTRVMQELKVEPYSSRFTTERARAEIEAHPPDLIVTGARLPGYARAALDQYLAKHQAEFTRKDGHFGTYLVRKR